MSSPRAEPVRAALVIVAAFLTAAAVALLVLTGGDDKPERKAAADPPRLPATDVPGAVTLLAAGDIAQCDSDGDEATARLAASFPDVPILALGDLVYPDGSADDFQRCYEPSWGPIDDRVRPAPGNHEYGTGNADAYFERYRGRAGTDGAGWYSYELNGWHVVVLNSNCDYFADKCEPGSEQERWLRRDLAGSKARCTLAYWHHPVRSSGDHGDQPQVEPLRRALVDAKVDVLLQGHDHHYERFAPRDGLTEWVVGTGGAGFYDVGEPRPGSEVTHTDGHGLLALTLGADRYRWRYLPADGARFEDSGAARCS